MVHAAARTTKLSARSLMMVFSISVMFLFFGIWYYLITSLGEVFDIGVKEYIRQRSLIAMFVRQVVRGCKKRTIRFKEEILQF